MKKAWLCLTLLLASKAFAQSAGTLDNVITNVDLGVSSERFAPGLVTATAAHPNGKRAYFARRYTHPLRHNLLVVTLDEKGQVVGGARSYLDMETALPLQATVPGQSTPQDVLLTLDNILVDGARNKLYLTHSIGAAPRNVNKLLTVLDLDANGDPLGAARGYDTSVLGLSAKAIVRHPHLNLLYLAGTEKASILIYPLDAKGEPQAEPQVFPVGENYKNTIAISEDGRRLYAGIAADTIEVVDLDNKGVPSGQVRLFRAGDNPGGIHNLALTPHALYLIRSTESGNRLGVWPLDKNGNPIGKVQMRNDIPVTAIATDPVRNRLWVLAEQSTLDVFSNKSIIEAAQAAAWHLNPDGTLGVAETKLTPHFGFRPVNIALGKEGTPTSVIQRLDSDSLGNLAKDYRLRVTPLEARLVSGEIPKTLEMRFELETQEDALGKLAVGQTSAWLNIDRHLKDKNGQRRGQVYAVVPVRPYFTPESLAYLKLRIDIAEGDPANGGKLIKSMTEEVMGNATYLLLPGYQYSPLSQHAQYVELLSEHAKKYAAAARAVTVKPEERPRLFSISTGMLGGQGSVEQLKQEAQTLAALGFSTVATTYWDNIPRDEVDQILDSLGLQRRAGGEYSPPSYFAFAQDKMNEKSLYDEWAKPNVFNIHDQSGGIPSDLVEFALADEPGWYYPRELDEVRKNPPYLEVFRAYLKEQNPDPQFFGVASWDKVLPIGVSAAIDLPSRRLFYWTMRFYTEQASAGLKLARQAVEKAVGHPIAAYTNWNNWGAGWYYASPGEKAGNQPNVTVDSAMGAFDWFESGRQSAHTLWTEDWFPTNRSQEWSYFTDMMRSASMLGSPGTQQPYGGYVVGRAMDEDKHPAGASYKVLSLLGHGAKEANFYTFGPAFIFADGWSELLHIYKPIADALRRVGKAERVLYPGKPARGKVAVHVPAGSLLWETKQHAPTYFEEKNRLHYALLHAGYTVDFVDDKDLSLDDWTKRGYTTLYLTGPNVRQAALNKIVQWVSDGGTLVTVAGAGAADEYNTPTAALDKVLGLQPRQAIRLGEESPGNPPKSENPIAVIFKDKRFGDGELLLHSPIIPLHSAGAAAVATYKDGGPAVTASTYGKGRAITYGFFPGFEYWATPDRGDQSELPRRWGAAQRQLTVAPAAIAKTPRPVTLSQPVVEACRLESEKGIAITLLNWSEGPVDALTVSVPNVGKFQKVTSIERGALKSSLKDGVLSITLPLQHVDVLMIE